MFCITIENKSICHSFFLVYFKNITEFLFCILWTSFTTSIKKDNANLLKLWCFSKCKKSTSSLSSFLRYCKDIANLLFWELWECLTIPIKIIASICSKLSCLFACKNQLHHTFFLRYCKEIANLLFWIIWACLATDT